MLLFTTHILAQDHKAGIHQEIYPKFLKNNTQVDSFQWKDADHIILYLKSGSNESYNLKAENERDQFIAKYGIRPQYSPTSTSNKRVSRRQNTTNE